MDADLIRDEDSADDGVERTGGEIVQHEETALAPGAPLVVFRVTEERQRKVTLRGQMAAADMDEGRPPHPRGLRDLLAPFIFDDTSNEFWEIEDARELLEDYDVDELMEAGTALVAALAESDLPKANRKRSKRRSGGARRGRGG